MGVPETLGGDVANTQHVNAAAALQPSSCTRPTLTKHDQTNKIQKVPIAQAAVQLKKPSYTAVLTSQEKDMEQKLLGEGFKHILQEER